jgi:hypothetical protein
MASGKRHLSANQPTQEKETMSRKNKNLAHQLFLDRQKKAHERKFALTMQASKDSFRLFHAKDDARKRAEAKRHRRYQAEQAAKNERIRRLEDLKNRENVSSALLNALGETLRNRPHDDSI